MTTKHAKGAWRDIFEVGEDFTFTYLLDKVMLEVLPKNRDPDQPDLVKARTPR